MVSRSAIGLEEAIINGDAWQPDGNVVLPAARQARLHGEVAARPRGLQLI